MTAYTWQVEVRDSAGRAWQSLETPETMDYPGTAQGLAELVAVDQADAVVDGDEWRVLVWAGTDTSVEPIVTCYADHPRPGPALDEDDECSQCGSSLTDPAAHCATTGECVNLCECDEHADEGDA